MLNIISNAIFGALAGYVTNHFAIKMIFRKIGPFGGVVLKTRDEFIEKTSNLVEREIINHRTIEKELARPEFREVFTEIISDIFNRYLYENTEEGMTWAGIPGLDESIDNFIDFYDENRDELIDQLLDPLLKNISLETLLSKEQIEHLSAELISVSITSLKDLKTIENTLTDLYHENREEKVSSFIAPAIFKEVANNFTDITADFHIQLKEKFEADIDQTIEGLYQDLNVSQILQEVEDSIKRKTLADMLGRENTENIANELLASTVRFLKSPEGKELITGFINDVMDILKGIEVSLLELFDKNIKVDLEGFMYSQLPDLVEDGILWIKSNKEEIEDLIDEAADDVLARGTGVKNRLKRGLKEAFLGNLAREYDIVDKIIKGIEDNTDLKQLSAEITGMIIEYIKGNSIGDIIRYLEDRNIIRLREMARLIDTNLVRLVAEVDLSNFDGLFETELGSLIDINLTGYFESILKDILLSKFKDEFLFSKPLTTMVQREVSRRIIESSRVELADLLREEYLVDSVAASAEGILQALEENQEDIKGKVAEVIYNFIQGKRLVDFITDDVRENMIKVIGENSTYHLRNKLNEAKYNQIADLYDYLADNEELVPRVTDLILELVTENLSLIIDGRIKDAAAKNLSKLPDQQLQEAVENFMGTHLKPITYFGGLLGLIAGILLTFGQGEIPFSQSFWPGLFTSAAVYGLVGWLTNVIALWMIFHPYQEKRLLGMKIPLTPGVVASNKEKFATSMGDFIDEELLKAETVDELFKNKIEKVKGAFKESIVDNNYEVVFDTLSQNSDLLAERGFQSLISYLDDNRGEVAAKTTEELASFNLAGQDLTSVQRDLHKGGKDFLLGSEHFLADKVSDFLQDEKSLGQLLPESLKPGIKGQLDQLVGDRVQDALDYIADEHKIKGLVREYATEFDSIIDKRIADLITPTQKQELISRVRELLVEMARSEGVKIALLDFLEDKFLQEMRPDHQLGRLFDGKLMAAAYNNLDYLIDFVFAKGVSYLQEERAVIKGLAINGIEENLEREKREGGWWDRVKVTATSGLMDALAVDNTVEEIVDDLVDSKLPDFLTGKRNEIKGLASRFLRQVERKRVAEIGIDLSRDGLEDVIDRFVNNELLITNLATLVDKVIDSILEIRLKSLLQIVSITNVFDIFKVFEEEVDLIRYSFSDNLYKQEEVVRERVSNLLLKVFDQLILTIPLNELAENVEDEDIYKSVQRIIRVVHSSNSFETNLAAFIDNTVQEIQYKNMDQLLSINHLQQDISRTLKALLADKAGRDDVAAAIKGITGLLLTSSRQIIDSKTKNYFLDLAVDSSIASLEAHFLELINSVNLRQVTEKEINNMDPAEIEELFNSFAARYFFRLKQYGWLGGGFGLIAQFINRFV